MIAKVSGSTIRSTSPSNATSIAPRPSTTTSFASARALHLTIDGKRQRVVTPLLFIGNNRYSLDAGSVGQRESLSDGVLSLFAVARQSPLALLGFAFRALLGKADAERDFSALADAKEVTIEGSGAIAVAFDGEVEQMALPLTFAIMPGALKVLVPAKADGGQATKP